MSVDTPKDVRLMEINKKNVINIFNEVDGYINGHINQLKTKSNESVPAIIDENKDNGIKVENLFVKATSDLITNLNKLKGSNSVETKMMVQLTGDFPFEKILTQNVKLRNLYSRQLKTIKYLSSRIDTLENNIKTEQISANEKSVLDSVKFDQNVKLLEELNKKCNNYARIIHTARLALEGKIGRNVYYQPGEGNVEDDIEKIEEYCKNTNLVQKQHSFVQLPEKPLTPNYSGEEEGGSEEGADYDVYREFEPDITVEEAKRRHLIREVKNIKDLVDSYENSNAQLISKIREIQKIIKKNNNLNPDDKTEADIAMEKENIELSKKIMESKGDERVERETNRQALVTTNFEIVKKWDINQIQEYQTALVKEYSKLCSIHNFLLGRDKLMESIRDGKETGSDNEWKTDIQLVVFNSVYRQLANMASQKRKTERGDSEKRESEKMKQKGSERKRAISQGNLFVEGESCEAIIESVRAREAEVKELMEKYEDKRAEIKEREQKLLSDPNNDPQMIDELQTKKKERLTIVRDEKTKNVEDMSVEDLRNHYEELGLMKELIEGKEKVIQDYEKELEAVEQKVMDQQVQIKKIEERINEEEEKILERRKTIGKGEENDAQYKTELELLTIQNKFETSKRDGLVEEAVQLRNEIRRRACMPEAHEDEETLMDLNENLKKIKEIKEQIKKQRNDSAPEEETGILGCLTLKERWYKAKYTFMTLPDSVSRVLSYKERWQNQIENKTEGTSLYVDLLNFEKYNDSVAEQRFYEHVLEGKLEELLKVSAKESSEESSEEGVDSDELEGSDDSENENEAKGFKFDIQDGPNEGVAPYEKVLFEKIEINPPEEKPVVVGNEQEKPVVPRNEQEKPVVVGSEEEKECFHGNDFESELFFEGAVIEGEEDDEFAEEKIKFINRIAAIRNELAGMIKDGVGLLGLQVSGGEETTEIENTN